MKKLLQTSAFILTVTFTMSSQAGWLDNVLGDKKESTTEKQATTSAEKTAIAAPAAVGEQSLTSLISSQLGVTDTQATGGLGAIFKSAKDTLSSDEFSELAAGVPGMDSLLSAAPSGEDSGMSGLLAKAGSAGELLAAFDKLGLSPEQISKFASVITDYFTGNDQADLTDLLMKGIGEYI